jgi:DNA-binding Xre family transcriptional regulator
MKKATNWDLYFQKQMTDPEVRTLVEEELKALRVGAQIAKLREERGLSQTELAAKVGMSGPNISRIETSPSQNLTLGTLVRLAAALGCDVSISFPSKRTVASKGMRVART